MPLDTIFMYFFHLIYIFSTFIFIFTFGGDARGGVTGIVEIKDRGLMRKLFGVPKILGLDPFPDPIGHFGFFSQCGVAGG